MSKLNFSRFRNKHFLVLTGTAFISLIGFATSFLLFHALSIAEVGVYIFIQSWVAICEAGRSGLLATATITFYAGAQPARAATVLGSVWMLAIALSAIILFLNAIAFLFLPYVHNTEIILCIKWIGITYFSSLIYDVIFWRLQAEEKYGVMYMLRMFNGLSSLLAFILLIMLHKMTLHTLLLFNLLTNLLTGAVGIMRNLAGLKTISRKSKECMVELMHFGKYTFGSMLSSSLLGNMNTNIINYMIGPAAVAVYNLAMRLLAYVEMPIRAFATTGMTEMAIAFNAKNMHQVTYILKKYSGLLTLALIPLTVFCFLFTDPLIHFMGGEKYLGTEAANVFRLSMIVALAYPIDRFNGIALDTIHKTKVNFYKVIVMLLVKIAGGIICLAIIKNVYGIVLSDFITMAAAILFGYYYLRKYINYSIRDILVTGYDEMKILLQKKGKLFIK